MVGAAGCRLYRGDSPLAATRVLIPDQSQRRLQAPVWIHVIDHAFGVKLGPSSLGRSALAAISMCWKCLSADHWPTTFRNVASKPSRMVRPHSKQIILIVSRQGSCSVWPLSITQSDWFNIKGSPIVGLIVACFLSAGSNLESLILRQSDLDSVLAVSMAVRARWFGLMLPTISSWIDCRVDQHHRHSHCAPHPGPRPHSDLLVHLFYFFCLEDEP